MNEKVFGLKPEQIAIIKTCLSASPKIKESMIFGSRAMGNFHEGSDIDLILKGEELTLEDVLKLRVRISENFLPYKFDIAIYHGLRNREFKKHIDTFGKLFYTKA